MAIFGVCGLNGGGKTYLVVRKALYLVQRGIDCYFNSNDIDFSDYPFLPPKKGKTLGSVYYWETIEDFKNIQNGVIFCDEGQSFLGSDGYKSLSMELKLKIQTHRKDSLDLYAISPRGSNINKDVRALYYSIWVVKRTSIFFLPPIFRARECDPADIEKEKKEVHVYQSMTYMLDKKIANCYDTMNKSMVKEKIDVNYKYRVLFDGHKASNLAGVKISLWKRLKLFCSTLLN